ncbi:hypothetical protein F4821DRAFT_225163 [Hypoxylon rubiginosum]|uniref:Uncharacterized protein n=1 Tax=Hypoxylon rubiginosum TaxID=110542 RepID=A0ACC0DHB1_9PEZI|nr:hypothetical protein F4821DRAFT_225163 [Hypoxylon rubiginosum]
MDAPPPPYTETDIYSHSGRSPNSQSGSDTASVTDSSCTIVYTPPETPRESHLSFSGGDDHHTSASAQAYFDSRPTFYPASGHDLVVPLAVSESSSPEEFPYPAWARERDTTEQDWHTFINYLLPDHAARSNSHIVERKLQAQDEAQSPESERTAAEAQLGHIKSSSEKAAHNVDDIIREWNDGFFGPRGLKICRQLPQPSFPGTASSRTPAAAEPQPQPQPQEQNARSRWNPFRPWNINNRGVQIGGLTIDNDRVSFGNSLEVDRNGVRWNGQNVVPGHSGPSAPGALFGPGPFGGFRGRGRGLGEPERGLGRGGRGRDLDELQRRLDGSLDELDRGLGRGGRGGRWRHDHHGPHDRSRSVSSHSSSSSSDSSHSGHSDSSIGSLPDWDDLKDTQLPLTKQSVAAWLAHPEQPVTKEMLKNVRSNIKAAKNAPPPANDPTWDANKKALRQEVKMMLAQFNQLKREQKRARRAARKQKRAERKALRRERRKQSRAIRGEERQLRRLGRQQRRSGNGSLFGPIHIPDVPQPPNIHIPSPPAIPNIHVPPVPNHSFTPVPSHPRIQPIGHYSGAGFFGGLSGAPWDAHVQRARELAAQGQAQARAQANLARVHAASVSANAQREAAAARQHAHIQANQARVQALQARVQANQARAQAAAAVAASARGCCSTPPWAPPQPRSGIAPLFATAPSSPEVDMLDHHGYPSADEVDAQFDAQFKQRMERLRALRATIDREGIEAAQRGDGDAKSKEKEQTEAQREAEKLEAEMEELEREAEKLRLDADEELARKMQEEEEKGGWR